ncbi:MAG: NfeD family protein [Leptolyngbyaceae cyanobacterium MO_188.B28]|nr:NfeD family protein [Leptolyngbyaceae cyanobacterium MO_188.B28]
MNPTHLLDEITLLPYPEVGKVDTAISSTQPGRVRFQGSHWPARFYLSDYQGMVLPNDSVKVVGRQGLTLLIVPDGCPLPIQFTRCAVVGQESALSRLSGWTGKLVRSVQHY